MLVKWVTGVIKWLVVNVFHLRKVPNRNLPLSLRVVYMIIVWCHLDGKIGNGLLEIGGELNVVYICWWHCGTQWNLGGVHGRIMLSIWQNEEAYMTGNLYKGEFFQRWQVLWLVIRCLPDWCKLARHYESLCSNQSKKITKVSWHDRLLQKVRQNPDKTVSLLDDGRW